MPSFSHLPAELRLCIAEVSSPRDCFNFALVNRATWELIKPIIKRHKTLAEKYSWLQTESSEHLVWTLLNDVLENPDVASYVRSIELNGSREVWHDPQVYYHTVLDQESLRPPPRDVERYVLAANRSPFLRTPLEPTMQSERMHNSEPMDLDQIIADGADGPIVALLLPMLENLQTLCYTMAGDCHWLLHILRQVVLAAHDQSRLSLPLPLPFQKLTRVSIACWSEDGGGDRWLHCILSLPALESFSANSLRGIDFSLTADDELRSMAPTSYNVSRLEFTHSDLDSSFLEWVIGRCKALKVFRYQNGAMHESFARYDPRALIAALISNCSQTLEELVLVDLEGSNRAEDVDERFDHPVHSLRDFKVLKTLHCCAWDWTLKDSELNDLTDDALDEGFLSPEQEKRFLRENGAFPLSLEAVHVDLGLWHVPVDETKAFLDELLAAKEKDLRSLKQVYVEHMEGYRPAGFTDQIEEFRERANRVGVEYKALRSFSDEGIYVGLPDRW